MRNLLSSLILIAFLLSADTGYACYCGFDKATLEQKIDKAAFVAHVKITDKEVVNIPEEIKSKTKTPLFFEGRVKFNIIELFKGPSISTVIEYGVNTSCDMGIEVGEEWMFFGYYDSTVNRYSVTACTPSTLHRNKEGESNGKWGGEDDFLNSLRKAFNHPLPVYKDGKNIGYYVNGNIEWEASFKDGSLHGNRRVYSANGILIKNENYLYGKQDGRQQYYSRYGQLLVLQEYKRNQLIHSVYWYDTVYTERKNAMIVYNMLNRKDSVAPARLQKQLESWTDASTGNLHSIIYSPSGIRQREFFSYRNGTEKLSCEYEENGMLKSEIFEVQQGDTTTEKRWDEKGQLISDKRWEKGKLVIKEK